MELELPELQIRLHQDSVRLPAGISIQFPRDLSLSLLRRRMATPVGNAENQPDLIVEDDDLQYVGFDLWPTSEVTAWCVTHIVSVARGGIALL